MLGIRSLIWIRVPLALVLSLMLAACGGGGGSGGGGGGSGGGAPAAPTITSFSAALSSIPAGGATTLTAVFANGVGTISNVGPVQSGVAVSVSPASTTTYTLTVTNSAGASVSTSATVTVTQPPTPIVLTFGTASLPYSGTVATYSNGYYRVTGLTAGHRYSFNVTATNYAPITYYSDAYQTQIKCDPNVSTALCILEAPGTDIYIRIWNSSFITSSTVGIDVTHVSAPTQFEGTWTAPTVLDMSVAGTMPHVGKTDTYNSYYTIQGLTVGQQYTFWLQSMTTDAWLSTLDPVSHTRVGGLCAPDNTWINGFQNPENCTWVATDTKITFAVANTSGTAGSAYILRVENAVTSEGSKATPVALAYASGKASATARVAAAGTSYYHVTGLTSGTNYLVSIAGIARSIPSNSYDPPTIQPYGIDSTYSTPTACAATAAVADTYQCTVAATGADLYFSVGGPTQYSGMTYNLTVSPVPVAQGNPTAIALTTAQLPYNGQVNQTLSGGYDYLYSNYTVSGLAPNTNYQVFLKGMTGIASLEAWATSSTVIGCAANSDTTATCSLSSGTGGAINIRVGAISNASNEYVGALYSLDVKPAFQLSANATYKDTSGTTTLAGTAIPDPGPTNNPVTPLLIPITVSGSAVTSISDVTVEFFITHGYAAQLTISLIAPDGTVVPLVAPNVLNTSMGGGLGFLGTQLNDYAPTRLDSADGGSPLATEPYYGVFRPRLPLHVLRGKNANGTWTLSILDDQYANISGQTGAYRAWGISFK